MNRVKRDFCTKGKHPNWRAWQANYDMSTLSWRFVNITCTFCGKEIVYKEAKASGPPKNYSSPWAEKILLAKVKLLKKRYAPKC